MGHLRYFWGISGVIAILAFAIFRLAPKFFTMWDYPLDIIHWLALLIFVPYMAYAEGYKGFHKAFSPRVVVRANTLRHSDSWLLAILAPIFCMGFFHATRKRRITTWSLSIGIILLVVMVRFAPQPWRGIVDAGVVVGLSLGILSILFFVLKMESGHWQDMPSPDLPEPG